MPNEPTKVSAHAGGIDALTASLRYLVVILTAVPAVIGLISAHDLVGLYQYFKGNEGSSVIAALVALGTAGYGIFKSLKRGTQVADAAANPAVTNLELK